MALAVWSDGVDDADGRLRLEVTFQDARHAEWALWQCASGADVIEPQWLRTALHDRAAAVADRYRAAPGARMEDRRDCPAG